MGLNSGHIVLGVTGSIAAYKSADLIRRLRDKGYDVSVVMTQDAERFITPMTLGALAGKKVYGQMLDDDLGWSMPHIELARQADALVIAPATANIIAKMAAGIADDLLTCLTLASKVPVFVAPAMNDEMYSHAAVQRNIETLQKDGVIVINPIKGSLACGSFGEGHLAEVDDIVLSIDKRLSS